MNVSSIKITLISCIRMLACLIFSAFFVVLPIDRISAAGDNKIIDMKLTITWREDSDLRIPYFNIIITNISGTSLRALDIRERPDFVDLYCDVVIVPLDANFEIERFIADPNVINETDYVELNPGESLEFKSIVLPIDYRVLVAGKYKAHAVYRIDPINRPKEIYRSDEIIFEIN